MSTTRAAREREWDDRERGRERDRSTERGWASDREREREWASDRDRERDQDREGDSAPSHHDRRETDAQRDRGRNNGTSHRDRGPTFSKNLTVISIDSDTYLISRYSYPSEDRRLASQLLATCTKPYYIAPQEGLYVHVHTKDRWILSDPPPPLPTHLKTLYNRVMEIIDHTPADQRHLIILAFTPPAGCFDDRGDLVEGQEKILQECQEAALLTFQWFRELHHQETRDKGNDPYCFRMYKPGLLVKDLLSEHLFGLGRDMPQSLNWPYAQMKKMANVHKVDKLRFHYFCTNFNEADAWFKSHRDYIPHNVSLKLHPLSRNLVVYNPEAIPEYGAAAAAAASGSTAKRPRDQQGDQEESEARDTLPAKVVALMQEQNTRLEEMALRLKEEETKRQELADRLRQEETERVTRVQQQENEKQSLVDRLRQEAEERKNLADRLQQEAEERKNLVRDLQQQKNQLDNLSKQVATQNRGNTTNTIMQQLRRVVIPPPVPMQQSRPTVVQVVAPPTARTQQPSAPRDEAATAPAHIPPSTTHTKRPPATRDSAAVAATATMTEAPPPRARAKRSPAPPDTMATSTIAIASSASRLRSRAAPRGFYVAPHNRQPAPPPVVRSAQVTAPRDAAATGTPAAPLRIPVTQRLGLQGAAKRAPRPNDIDAQSPASSLHSSSPR